MRVLIAGWLALTGTGCILPFPGDDLPPLPPARNRPPRIEELNVSPQGRLVSLDVGNGCAQEFSLPVSDPDVDDLLTVRWFVDFDSTPEEGQPPTSSFESLIPPSSLERRGSARITLRTDAAGSPLAPPGIHLVEAYLSDGRLQIVEQNGVLVVQPLPRDVSADGGVVDPNYVVSYAWFVQTPVGCPTASGVAP